MTDFDLTPQTKTPPKTSEWARAAFGTELAVQNEGHITNLRSLVSLYHANIRLDSINIHATQWPSELLMQIYLASYPLRALLSNPKVTIKISREWLCYWELFAHSFNKFFSQRIKANKAQRELAGTKSRHSDFPIRTFHISDDAASSVQALQKAINRIEMDSASAVKWDWLATYTISSTEEHQLEHAKHKEKWSIGVDGMGHMDVNNMRAWKNKISGTIKVVDAIISNSSSEDDIPHIIAFALINLAADGCAYIYIPRIASTALASMIHLFRQCFHKTFMYHTVAMDRLYLCGESFLNNLSTKHHNLLYDFCAGDEGTSSAAPFEYKYLTGESFQDTINLLARVNISIQNWRYRYYEKFLSNYKTLMESISSKSFESYAETFLESQYKDESKKWVLSTGFIYFSGNGLEEFLHED